MTYLYLPRVNSSDYADMWAGGSVLIGIVRYVVVPGPISIRWTWLQRLWLIHGVLWLLRAVTILVTPLPNPYHQCVPHTSYPKNIFMEAFANMPFFWWWKEMTCQDVMFSGHTAGGTVG